MSGEQRQKEEMSGANTQGISATQTCKCGGWVGPDKTGRPMCYGCGPVEMCTAEALPQRLAGLHVAVTPEAVDKVITNAHRAMDAMGVSHSVYGQMAREQHIREKMGSGWAGNPADLYEQARREAARQIAGAPLYNAKPIAQECLANLQEESKHARLAVFPGVGGERRFTRAEVLAVLRAKKAMITAMSNPLEVLAHLIQAFERME